MITASTLGFLNVLFLNLSELYLTMKGAGSLLYEAIKPAQSVAGTPDLFLRL